jgi:hypothetical protein
MTRSRDIDHLLDRWMDDGPTVVADRVIAAALTGIPTTRQRGARWALLKELFMTGKPAMTVLGIAAAAVVALAAFQILAGGGGVGGPRVITADDLPAIVLPADQGPEGMQHDITYDDERILLRPIISVTGTDAVEPYLEQPGFVAGRYTEFSHSTAGLLSWAALFESAEDAQRSLDLYIEEVESEAGYGLGDRADLAFGDEGSFWDDDAPENDIQVILWRSGTLVMAAATFGDFDPDELRTIAEQMDDRAQ